MLDRLLQSPQQDTKFLAEVLDTHNLVTSTLREARKVFFGRGVVGEHLEYLADIEGVDRRARLEERLGTVESDAVQGVSR
jgi:hypothetical protein